MITSKLTRIKLDKYNDEQSLLYIDDIFELYKQIWIVEKIISDNHIYNDLDLIKILSTYREGSIVAGICAHTNTYHSEDEFLCKQDMSIYFKTKTFDGKNYLIKELI